MTSYNLASVLPSVKWAVSQRRVLWGLEIGGEEGTGSLSCLRYVFINLCLMAVSVRQSKLSFVWFFSDLQCSPEVLPGRFKKLTCKSWISFVWPYPYGLSEAQGLCCAAYCNVPTPHPNPFSWQVCCMLPGCSGPKSSAVGLVLSVPLHQQRTKLQIHGWAGARALLLASPCSAKLEPGDAQPQLCLVGLMVLPVWWQKARSHYIWLWGGAGHEVLSSTKLLQRAIQS